MPRSRPSARVSLDDLWNTFGTLGVKRLKADGHMADLSGLKILHVIAPDVFTSTAYLMPLSFFQFATSTLSPRYDPVPATRPLLAYCTQDNLPYSYFEYVSSIGRSTKRWASYVAGYVSHWANNLRVDGTRLKNHLGIVPLEYPSPFFLDDAPIDSYYPNSSKSWSVHQIRETEKKDGSGGAYPHLVVQMYSPFDGQANSILYSELWTLTAIMKHRANQRKVDEDAEQEALIESSSAEERYEKIEQYNFEFAEEKHFPVLLLSYVGVQHARVIFAGHGQRHTANLPIAAF